MFHSRVDESMVFLPIAKAELFSGGRLYVFDSPFPRISLPLKVAAEDMVSYQQIYPDDAHL